MRRSVTCTVIEADKPTVNKRIYPRHVLESFVEQCNRGTIFVTDRLEGTSVALSNVVARATDFALDPPSGRIVATIETIATPAGQTIEQIIDHLEFSPMVIGSVDADGVIQDDAKVAYFALTPKEK